MFVIFRAWIPSSTEIPCGLRSLTQPISTTRASWDLLMIKISYTFSFVKVKHLKLYCFQLDSTGEYFTKKSIFCQGPRQRLSFFSEKIFGNFLIKLPYFWTICAKNAKFWIIWQNIGNIMIKIE